MPSCRSLPEELFPAHRSGIRAGLLWLLPHNCGFSVSGIHPSPDPARFPGPPGACSRHPDPHWGCRFPHRKAPRNHTGCELPCFLPLCLFLLLGIACLGFLIIPQDEHPLFVQGQTAGNGISFIGHGDFSIRLPSFSGRSPPDPCWSGSICSNGHWPVSTAPETPLPVWHRPH